jgi:hypothetical protein
MALPAEIGPGPLGARADAALNADRLRALRTIEAYDLTYVCDRLIKTGVMTPAWADQAVFEFRRYLGLCAVFAEPIPMLSRDVDEVWHTCLLFTRLYADLCDRVFGRFLHHDPSTESAADRRAAWAEFETAYRALYGEPGPLWQMSRPF